MDHLQKYDDITEDKKAGTRGKEFREQFLKLLPNWDSSELVASLDLEASIAGGPALTHGDAARQRIPSRRRTVPLTLFVQHPSVHRGDEGVARDEFHLQGEDAEPQIAVGAGPARRGVGHGIVPRGNDGDSLPLRLLWPHEKTREWRQSAAPGGPQLYGTDGHGFRRGRCASRLIPALERRCRPLGWHRRD